MLCIKNRNWICQKPARQKERIPWSVTCAYKGYKYFLSYTFLLLVNVIYGGDPPCPANIKTCYNCEVVPGCLENEYNNLSEQECLDKLTSQLIIWSVEYVHASGYCRESKCEDIEIQYKEGSVIHRKTCDSSCKYILLSFCVLLSTFCIFYF